MARSGNGRGVVEKTPVAAKGGHIDVRIPAVLFAYMTVTVRGTTPLIVNRFSEKAKEQMAAKQQGKARQRKPAKVPEEDAKAALYLLSDGGYGAPAIAFKKAMVSGCRHVDDIPMTLARGAFHVYGDDTVNGRDLVRLTTPGWRMREDEVRLETGVADLRYRPEFGEWSARLRIRYMPNSITPERIIHLLSVAGFAVGICENRAEKSGDIFGQFEVVAEAEKN